MTEKRPIICMRVIELIRGFFYVVSSVWLQGKDKTQNCKSNKKTSEKFNNYINKQETKGSNHCVGEYKNVIEINKKMFVVILIEMN